jgi:hypothetical protein
MTPRTRCAQGWCVLFSFSLAANLTFVSSSPAGYLPPGSLVGSNFTYFPTPTKWDPGLNTAQYGGFPSPGGASWSATPSGVPIADIAPFAETIDHPAGAMSVDIIDLITGAEPTGSEYEQFNMALDLWASVSGFTNLGKVSDGATQLPLGSGASGDVDAANGHLGDIRVTGYLFDGPGGVVAHGFQPGTAEMFGGTMAGDIHLDHEESWVDDPADAPGNGRFDFFTAALHEIGHSLGLDHSYEPGSVMQPFYSGARRTLHADDIAGVQSIYGVPELTTVTPGDGNGDGKDYLIWAGNFGDDPAQDPPGSPANGDFSDDGVVDGYDYLIWAINFGQGPNDGIAVPEPGSLSLLVLGYAAVAFSRRRDRTR